MGFVSRELAIIGKRIKTTGRFLNREPIPMRLNDFCAVGGFKLSNPSRQRIARPFKNYSDRRGVAIGRFLVSGPTSSPSPNSSAEQGRGHLAGKFSAPSRIPPKYIGRGRPGGGGPDIGARDLVACWGAASGTGLNGVQIRVGLCVARLGDGGSRARRMRSYWGADRRGGVASSLLRGAVGPSAIG